MAEMRKPTIALCISGVEPQYQCVFLDSVCKRCNELGYNVAVFYSMADNLEHTMSDAGETDIYTLPNFELFKGLIILGRQFSKDILLRITDSAKKYEIPIATINREIEDCYSLSFEYASCIKTMVRHFFAKHGFTHINFMGGSISGVSAQRLTYYKEAMTEFGLLFNDESIGFCDYKPELVEEQIERFMKSDVPPQAIICVNDSVAILVSEALAKLGYNVPEDVCVSGFDGISEARDASPKITTAYADATMAANKAVELIDDILHSKTVKQKIMLPLIYDFTESCGCVKLDTSHNHETIHNLYSKISTANDFSKAILKLNEKMTNIKTKQEQLEKITESVKKCWSRKTWLCVCSDYFTDKTPEVYDDFTNERRGYTVRMEALIHTVDKEACERRRYATWELLPDFDKEIDESGAIIFVPLHLLGRTIGYFALDYQVPDHEKIKNRGFDMLHTWLTTVSVILENIRVQSELTSYAERINELYITDPLTELYNRRGFYQTIRREIIEFAADGDELTIISSDLDNLKEINDMYGHKEGDFAISAAANALKRAAGENGICARFGGDEFVAFVPRCDIDGANRIIEALNEQLSEINDHSDKPYRVAISAGTAVTTLSDDFSIDTLISKADAAMYEVKKKNHRERLR